MGGAVEVDLLQGALVVAHHFLKAVDPWVEDVAVESETVRRSVAVGRHRTPKAVQVDLLV